MDRYTNRMMCRGHVGKETSVQGPELSSMTVFI